MRAATTIDAVAMRAAAARNAAEQPLVKASSCGAFLSTVVVRTGSPQAFNGILKRDIGVITATDSSPSIWSLIEVYLLCSEMSNSSSDGAASAPTAHPRPDKL